MNIAHNPRRLNSFDHSTSVDADVFSPDRYRVWDQIDESPQRTMIPRGAGLSYVAASFGDNSIVTDMRKFDRILDFDSSSGELLVEAGASLGKVFSFLKNKGFYLSTQPGHPSITIGGCIAADVHGKNQSIDGNFSKQVVSLFLYHPKHGLMNLCENENSELFEMTCGGYGLTGIIVKARLKTKKLPSHLLEVKTHPISTLSDLETLFTSHEMGVDLLYSWHDLHTQREHVPGFIKTGKFINQSVDGSFTERFDSLDSSSEFPFNLYNRFSMKCVNTVFFKQELKGSKILPLFDFMFPVAKKSIYFKLFGKTGFFESQCLFPTNKFPGYVDELRSYLRRHKPTVTLASGKRFRGSQKYLRFDGDGVCFAINTPRNPVGVRLMRELNRLCIQHSGIPNIIKNSTLDQSTIEKCYTQLDNFRTRLKEFDPNLVFRSQLSERLGL